MKKTILLSLIALMFFNLNISAQETNYFQKKNEFNVQIDDIFAKNNLFTDLYLYDMSSEYYFPQISYGPTLGLGYKHHFTKGAIRIKVNIATRAQKYQIQDGSDDYKDDSKFASHKERISAGYEWHSNLGRTQIFYGLDATISIEAIATESYRYANYEGSDYTVENTQGTFTYGVKPFLGFKYFISPMFSVSTEYHILLEGYATKNVNKNSLNDTEQKTRQGGFETKIGPIGQLTFSFHF
ncbi:MULTISPECIES: hypothetical protein [unclassified Lentimicrobium]|uniref:hypothetical protein n=1 Tax=unclassified Lentimicrobium TaxID=2677434 RepID=UPI0015578A52|nr:MULTISPECIES: hypothetical protein [unclassified Lentimicrobium]NPD47151.1 hypothetical protein [Lentimicrobium sp. S6]NPD83676.1 hypothetical protein [Lentimicrobium sp. L6]